MVGREYFSRTTGKELQKKNTKLETELKEAKTQLIAKDDELKKEKRTHKDTEDRLSKIQTQLDQARLNADQSLKDENDTLKDENQEYKNIIDQIRKLVKEKSG